TPSGWTSLASQTQRSTHAAVFYRSNFTGTSVTLTDLGQSVGNSASVLFEIRDTSGGTGATSTPSTVPTPVSAPAPSVSTGVNVAAGLVAAAVSVFAATIGTVTNTTPAAVSAAVSVPAPTVT